MIQIKAILVDSMRHLRSSSLFWIAIVISALVALVLFGIIRFTPEGYGFLIIGDYESERLREGSPGSRYMISWLFGGAFMWWWLSWGAIVLAIISTASIVPDFVKSGAIDMTLAKPISRAKIFIVKFCGASLFMLAQVTVGVVIAYLLIGMRFGVWYTSAFIAIPLLLLQFIYLYAISAVVGLLTRNSLAALIITLIFWGMLSIVQLASNELDSNIAAMTSRIERADARLETLRETIETEGREPTEDEAARLALESDPVASVRELRTKLLKWQPLTTTLETIVPKTGDVQKIIAERIGSPTFPELVIYLETGMEPRGFAEFTGEESSEDEQLRDALAGSRETRTVNAPLSIGTSLGFTFVVLAFGAFIFMRRDF